MCPYLPVDEETDEDDAIMKTPVAAATTEIGLDIDIGELRRRATAFRSKIAEVRRGIDGVKFYPYDTLANFDALDRLLTGDNRRFLRLAEGGAVADVGAADGDLAFFLETLGCEVHIVDNGPTNFNNLRAARALKKAFESRAQIHEVDLDSQFSLPQEKYGLVFFLGLLYHLKNPFYAMERLARSARHVVLSTRVAQYAQPLTQSYAEPSSRLWRLASRALRRLPLPIPVPASGMTRIAGLPVAYLVDERECNNDPTNYWMFTVDGLRRLLRRCGWEILDFTTTGNTLASDPASQHGDERAWCLARSRVRG
jgi:tRNA (mo5U34)-methyltransferase